MSAEKNGSLHVEQGPTGDGLPVEGDMTPEAGVPRKSSPAVPASNLCLWCKRPVRIGNSVCWSCGGPQ